MLQWHHPRLYPERPANESPLRYNSKSDTPGWEIDVPLSTESATVYLNVSVNWYGWLFGQLRSGAPYMAGFRVSAITSDRRFSPRTSLRQHPVPWRNPAKKDVIHAPSEVRDMKTPPAAPPEVYLASSEALQEGHHGASDWTVDGEKIAVRNKQYPLVWPVPLNVSSSDTVIVRFVTESVPGRIEVRQFGRVDSDGKLAGTTLSVTDWNHPKFSSSQFSDGKPLRYNSEVSPPGWELELKVVHTGCMEMVCRSPSRINCTRRGAGASPTM